MIPWEDFTDEDGNGDGGDDDGDGGDDDGDGDAQWSRRGVLGKKIKNLFCTFVGQFRPILKWKMLYKVPLRRFVHFKGVRKWPFFTFTM